MQTLEISQKDFGAQWSGGQMIDLSASLLCKKKLNCAYYCYVFVISEPNFAKQC